MRGRKGIRGSRGIAGSNGATPTISIGTTTTLTAGSPATVTENASSTPLAKVWDFGVPRGADGSSGGGGAGLQNARALFVSSVNGNDSTGNGTIGAPWATLAPVLALPALQPATIYVQPGSIGSPGSPTNYNITQKNWQFKGETTGWYDSSSGVYYTFSTSGTAQNLKMAGILISPGPNDWITITDGNGSHYFASCVHTSLGGPHTGAFIRAKPSARGFLRIANCDLTGGIATWNIVLENLSGGGTATLEIYSTFAARVSIGTGWTVKVNNCPDFVATGITATNCIFTDPALTQARVFTSPSAINSWLTRVVDSTQDGYGVCSGFTPTGLPAGYAAGAMLLKQTVPGVITSVQIHRQFPWSAVMVLDLITFGTYKLSAAGYVVA
jgi:hypothetical protein